MYNKPILKFVSSGEGIFLSIEKVREYFSGLGMEDRILEFDVSSATVELAAQALKGVADRFGAAVQAGGNVAVAAAR